MTKEQMMNEVIRNYGFENMWTIWFCELAEILTESQLLNAFILVMSNTLPHSDDED